MSINIRNYDHQNEQYNKQYNVQNYNKSLQRLL